MTKSMMTRDDVMIMIDSLPADKWQDLVEFVEFLQFKSAKQPRKLIQLGGLWKHLPHITEEDIAEARQEMWSNFGERDL